MTQIACPECEKNMEHYDERRHGHVQKHYWRCASCHIRAIERTEKGRDGIWKRKGVAFHRYSNGKKPEYLFSVAQKAH